RALHDDVRGIHQARPAAAGPGRPLPAGRRTDGPRHHPRGRRDPPRRAGALTSIFRPRYTEIMKQMLCVLVLATLSGCYYPAYSVRRVAPAEPPVTREETERLAAAGVSDPVVVELVEKRGAAPLTPDDLVALKKAGV